MGHVPLAESWVVVARMRVVRSERESVVVFVLRQSMKLKDPVDSSLEMSRPCVVHIVN